MPLNAGIRYLRAGFLAACAVSILGVPLSSSLYAQQSGLQTSFFSPAAAHLTSSIEDNRVSETDDVPYMDQVAKENKTGAANFQPTASDLLIGQAEDKFQSGRRFYRDGNYGQARQDFDSAIDLMLQASDNPTDRPLFELKLEDMVDSIHRFDLSGLGAAAVETTPQFDKAPLEDIAGMTFPVDPKIKDRVQIQMKTTASALPLVVNDVVLGYINYFNGKGRRTIEYGLERAAKYQPMISKILAEEGVPQELIHLAQAESGFLPRAVSRAAAEGMWQFVKFRGNEYGLMQTPSSDDRLDPEKATRAAARHLHDLYNEFHDWYLAIAAYNCGPGGVERAVERTGYADYWELRSRHALPNETANYVPIILAMTIMEKNAAEYGLDHLSYEQPLEYDTLRLETPTNLALIGDLTETSLPELQQLNPALLRGTAPTGYDLRLPKGLVQQVDAELAKVPAEIRSTARLHHVQDGENLAAIAKRYNASPKAIASVNGIGESEPSAGDRLLIPSAYHEVSVPAVRAARNSKTSSKHPIVVASAKPAAKRGTAVVASAKAPAKTPAKTPAKAPASHKSLATVAQVSHKSSSVNR
jgi:membrane-bound lytic murein transglycosylase D